MTTPRSADWCCRVAAAGKHDFVFRDDVEVYHMVLEGIGFDAGQRALLDELSDGALPGVREGVERVERDERWHIGFGLRWLIEAQPSPELLDDLLARAQDAAAAWGDAVAPRARRAHVCPAIVVTLDHRHFAAVNRATARRSSSFP